ncbi:E3 ubiquitin-protein ligase NRDP1-like [Dendronephthya gigantea]|uniref:E3 ubiquitin-protein ligase NRDP1-like n=1 Tax=Dendronephthya gigantea TaxID=151771 RepID=UPI00106D97FA|nr:E3 ubiquitin-protein ligase NRDP1-like [Dendronephthya gigantea]
MGYAIQRFVSNIDPNLICGICANVLKDAVITPCGHSFCQQCLETWLDRSETDTCPTCRTTTLVFDLIPVLAVRGIVGNLHTSCENAENGCKMVMKLDSIAGHVRHCEYASVKCYGCGEQVKKFEVPEHHANCKSVKSLTKGDRKPKNSVVEELSKTVASLEADLKRTKKALKISQDEVRKVERELREIRNDFNTREGEQNAFDQDWDPDYNYGYSPQSISLLARLISRYLLEKPFYIDRNRIFTAAKRCYDFYYNYPGYTQDVHMLVATCFASNWFSEQQRKHFNRWLGVVVTPQCSR